MDCIICKKHANFDLYTGNPVAELGGMVVSHFPVINGAPANKGHFLIEAQRHVVDTGDLTDEESKSLGFLISKSIKVLTSGLGAEHAYAFRINDLVPHFHFHIIARYPNTPKEFWGHKISDWPGTTKLDLVQVKLLSDQIRKLY